MINLQQLSLRRDKNVLFADVNLRIHAGWKMGVAGRNGTGKSSLFAMLRGELHADTGQLEMPSGWVIAHVSQETPGLPQAALDFVMDGDVHLRELESAIAKAEGSDDGHRLAVLHTEFDTIGGYTAKARASTLLHGLGFSDDELSQPVKNFSGGWRVRLNLARALMCPSGLLLLDEPTNHLDLEAVLWLEQWLRRYPGTLLLISHDRDFLDNVVNYVAHLDGKSIRLYQGNYSSYEKQHAEDLMHQRAMQSRQQREIQHMRSFVNRFRAQATKARQAQSRLKALEKMEIIAIAHVDAPFKFAFSQPEKLPLSLLHIDGASVGYGDTPLIKNINLRILPGTRIGLLGPNGAGKSTLIRLLAGELPLLSGQREEASGLKIGYFAQHQMEQLDGDASPLILIQRLEGKVTEQEIRNYLGGFGFQLEHIETPCRQFSGGEKARLMIAILIWQRPNLLLLDEPTNHLDLEMRHALTVALQEFQGAMIIVSHDRHLLRTTADDLMLVADQRVDIFPGDLDDYRQSLKEPDNNAVPKSSDTNLRKQQRQQAAAERERRQPLQKQIKKLEQQLEKINQEKAALEEWLADPAVYQTDDQTKVQEAMKKRASLTDDIEAVELEWLDLSEQLENF